MKTICILCVAFALIATQARAEDDEKACHALKMMNHADDARAIQTPRRRFLPTEDQIADSPANVAKAQIICGSHRMWLHADTGSPVPYYDAVWGEACNTIADMAEQNDLDFVKHVAGLDK